MPLRALGACVHGARARQFAAYFGASLVALAIDCAVMVALVEVFRLDSGMAAVVGYSIGAVVAYCGCVLLVPWGSAPRTSAPGFALFVSLGAIGFLVTWGVMWAGAFVGAADYRLVKSVAAAASFLSNYGARKFFLFD